MPSSSRSRMPLVARDQAGFTLIELLVVIAILAILAGVVVFAVGNSTDNAKKTACQTELKTVKAAIAAAKAANETNATPEAPESYLESSAGQYWRINPANQPTAGNWTVVAGPKNQGQSVCAA
jgi:prepilin-type N-terminal cleavage/methylation domain-containing protein